MKIKFIWLLILPFKFQLEENVEQHVISISGVQITPIKTQKSKYYDSIRVEYPTEVDNDFEINSLTNFEMVHKFKDETTQRVGVEVNKFIASYYRHVEHDIIGQVFNGDDFITEYEMAIVDENENVIDTVQIGNRGVRIISNKLYETIRDDIENESRNISHEFIRIANCFLENGYLDMAVMNLAMALESAVKTYVLSKGISPQDLNEKKGYVDKFYDVGMRLTKGKSLKEDDPQLFEVVETINDLRNAIAHGKHIKTIDKFLGSQDYEIFDCIEDLILDGEDILSWITD